jgi:hypothetical protein
MIMRPASNRVCGLASERGPIILRFVSLDADLPKGSRPGAGSHAAAARNVTIRLMLNAALAKTKSASTVVRPRSFTFRSPAIV